MTTEPAALGDELLACVARLNRWASRHAELDLAPAQARLLAQLEELGPSRIGDLARADHCSQPTMSVQVQRLETQGLARRSPDPQDARATLVQLLPAGTEALARVRASRSSVVAPLIGALSPAQRERLRAGIDALHELLTVADSAPLNSASSANSAKEERRVAST